MTSLLLLDKARPFTTPVLTRQHDASSRYNLLYWLQVAVTDPVR
ncbi:Uncharacterised protein [Yersinia pseudotuberculosis]|nr:Uncharacterised protein [Yersinia pseudotuberculosis]